MGITSIFAERISRVLVVQVLILLFTVVAVPVVAGGIFADPLWGGSGRKEIPGESGLAGILFRWVAGQMVLWAGFQVICVPFILRERRFSDVVKVFVVYMAAIGLLSLAREIRCRASRPGRHKEEKGKLLPWKKSGEEKTDLVALGLWCCVAVMLLLQLLAACFLAYEEGDDAYYVAISTSTADADTMYQKLPYTGGASELDARHALAPFPIWVAFLSKISGMHPATVAQVALPVILIGMGYGVYYLLGRKLCKENTRKLPMFLLLVECLVLFGGYSTYSAENFLLVRTAQGKAVLASIVIPFLLLLLYLLLQKQSEEKKAGPGYWCLLALTMAAGCLCSTLGSFLTCLFVAIVGLCGAVCFRRWKLLPPMAACCIMPLCVIFLYFRLR